MLHILFSFIWFFGLEALFLYILSSATPQKTACGEVQSRMAANLRIGSPLQWGRLPDSNLDCRFRVWCHYQ